MLEKDFLEKIDCKFPYNDINKGKEIIDESLLISDNAVFGILHELLRVPKNLNKKIKKENITFFLSYIDNTFKHELKNDFINIILKRINNKDIKESEVLEIMNKIKGYKSLSYGLNILYFIISDSTGNIESKYNEVINYWKIN